MSLRSDTALHPRPRAARLGVRWRDSPRCRDGAAWSHEPRVQRRGRVVIRSRSARTAGFSGCRSNREGLRRGAAGIGVLAARSHPSTMLRSRGEHQGGGGVEQDGVASRTAVRPGEQFAHDAGIGLRVASREIREDAG